MYNAIKKVRNYPLSLLWFIGAMAFFGLITTVLSIYPIISSYALKTPQVFLSLETWESFLVYTYNTSAGGIINSINTVLFGAWVSCFSIYRKTYINQGTTLMRVYKAPRTATLGGLAAILGGGCIGCGFTFLTNIFGAALGSILVSLPMKGAELSLIGTIIISFSLYRIIKQIAEFEAEPVITIPNTSSTPTNQVSMPTDLPNSPITPTTTPIETPTRMTPNAEMNHPDAEHRGIESE